MIGIVRHRGVQDQTSTPQANLPAAVAPRPDRAVLADRFRELAGGLRRP